MRRAVRAQHRRQAWYLARRILALDPGDKAALGTRGKWSAALVAEPAPPPDERFVRERDATLVALGARYAALAASRSDADPDLRRSLLLRARAYGCEAPAVAEFLAEQGLTFLGSFGAAPQAEVDPLLAAAPPHLRWLPEYDDAHLGAAVRWPQARSASVGDWRLHTDLPATDALATLTLLADAEAWMVRAMGSTANPADSDRFVDAYVFATLEDLDRVGGAIVDDVYPPWRDRFLVDTGTAFGQRGLLLVPWRDRDEEWRVGPRVVLGPAARLLALRHFGSAGSGLVQGRGAWLVAGFAGALEGFVKEASGRGGIDPDRCWRLAAARALRAEGALLPWDRFLELDDRSAREVPRRRIAIRTEGREQTLLRCDVVAAQATALVLGLLLADREEGPRQVARLLTVLHQRDRLPDLDKTLGGKRGRVIELAEAAMDGSP
jgi:hypothetical protein